MFKDYYKILQLGKTATQEEIKQRFRELALKYHPDVSVHKNAHDIFVEINEAYQILGDVEKRIKYDKLYNRDLVDLIEEQNISNDLRKWAELIRKKAQQKAKESYKEYIKEFECYFNDSYKADGKPYMYHMHTVSGISGGVGPTGSIKSRNVSVVIPRSKKAQKDHNIGMLIKIVFFGLALTPFILFNISTFVHWLLFLSILVVGGVVCHIFYRLNKTKSIFYYAKNYPMVKQYRKKGYSPGFHVSLSTTPLGIIAYIGGWVF